MTSRDGIIAAYAEMLLRYHRTLDLISDQALADLDRHIAEARVYVRLIEEHAAKSPTILDLGSGAGLPGVVIAALLPEAEVVLVERRRRRKAFLELVTSRLGLTNTTVRGHDVRRLSGICAEVVTAQAVGSLAEVIGLTRHLQGDPCLLLSRRGADWRRELAQVSGVLDVETSAGDRQLQLPSKAAPGTAGGGPAPARRRTSKRHVAAGPAGGRAAIAVLVEEPLGHRGSLVALRLAGGPACRASE